jgi:uncharacterized protein (DUF433 family)
MKTYLKRMMITACKRRLAEGMSWDEIYDLYPKLTNDEFEEIKTAVEEEDGK